MEESTMIKMIHVPEGRQEDSYLATLSPAAHFALVRAAMRTKMSLDQLASEIIFQAVNNGLILYDKE